MAARDVTEARCDYQTGTIFTHNAIEFCCDEGDAWLVGDLSKGLARHFHATDDQIVLGHKTRTRAGTIPADRSSSVSHYSGARRTAAILPTPAFIWSRAYWIEKVVPLAWYVDDLDASYLVCRSQGISVNCSSGE